MSTPDALRIANELDYKWQRGLDPHEGELRETAAELRRQHAEIERLRGIVPEVLERLNDELCAENERLRADAARLRAAMNEALPFTVTLGMNILQAALDEGSAIDAAMRDARVAEDSAALAEAEHQAEVVRDRLATSTKTANSLRGAVQRWDAMQARHEPPNVRAERPQTAAPQPE